jgi:glutamyl/glutaminyl-tRNA synthetase
MITRFAPAPTGYLHLGHVANARLVWNEAHARNGRVLLRIEDHDRERCRPEYDAALLEDLAWLGFEWDEAAVRQSERHHLYAEVAGELQRRGLVYGCVCTRRMVQGSTSPEVQGSKRSSAWSPGSSDPGIEVPYQGTCRHAGHELTDDIGWRVRLSDDVITFEDRWCGVQTQQPSTQCGDLLIRDRRGNWTYHFVATVDDHLQGVTDVIRGCDLLESTGRQILLGRMIGRPAPATFAHHALIMKSATQKLSKSDGDTGVRDLRAAGWTRDQVLAAAVLPSS